MAEIMAEVANRFASDPTAAPYTAYPPRYGWQVAPAHPVPSWLVATVGAWAAQLLWQRGKCTPEAVQSFIKPDCYTPTSGWAFGAEMTAAVNRLQVAHQQQESVVIWGDFDSDGITATAVLWEGLAPWFPPHERLHFYIPDRLKESHGLSMVGLERLRQDLPMARLIITCDTGSSNYDEILYAQSLGFELIITDHHTLPSSRPPVIALINSRNFATDHPLYHLSGVAVAYKLIEVLYEVMPNAPAAGCKALLDLVAIGLIADLVQLEGDCRYLAQKGLMHLKRMDPKIRPGLVALARQCRSAGDRARDISYGVAPRLNAASRIWGCVNDCVELLTTKDKTKAQGLVERLELANTERKDLQRQTKAEIQKRINQLDLSTTGVILLADQDWSVGILGLVAGELVKEYQRPVILCTIDGDLAQGSARAPAGVDLYSLLQGQENLLTRFGGHPLAGGLSFPLVHLPLLQEALNQNFWQQYPVLPQKELTIDLTVQLSEINRENFEQLDALEPYGMGNPPPNLRVCQVLIRDAKYVKTRVNRKGQNTANLPIGYTEFKLLDPYSDKFLTGRSWHHEPGDLPSGLCDVVVNLTDFDLGYRVILLDVMQSDSDALPTLPMTALAEDWAILPLNLTAMPPVWDYRTTGDAPYDIMHQHLQATQLTEPEYVWCRQCPTSWQKLQHWLNQSAHSQGLVLAYVLPHSPTIDHKHTWRTLVGIAKYLQRVGGAVPWQQIALKVAIDQPRLLWQGLRALRDYGYGISITDAYGYHYDEVDPDSDPDTAVSYMAPNLMELMEQNWQISCQWLPCDGLSSQDQSSSSLYHYPQISPHLELFWAGVTEYRFQQQFFDSQWQNYQQRGLKWHNLDDYSEL